MHTFLILLIRITCPIENTTLESSLILVVWASLGLLVLSVLKESLLLNMLEVVHIWPALLPLHPKATVLLLLR